MDYAGRGGIGQNGPYTGPALPAGGAKRMRAPPRCRRVSALAKKRGAWPNAEAALSLRNVGWHSAIAAPFAQWFDVALPDGSSARIWVYDWSVCDAGDVAWWFVIARMTNPAGSENLLPVQFDDPSQFR